MLLTATARSALGEEAPPARVVAVGAALWSCPSRDEVARQLERLLPEAKIVAVEDGPPSSQRVMVVEEPGGFRVEVGAHSRHHDDPPRVCERRARLAAVSASVLLDLPPEVSPQGGPAGTSALVAARPRRGLATRVKHASVAAAARMATAVPLGEPGLLGAGLAVRVLVRGARVGATVGGAFDANAPIEYAGLRLLVRRTPLDAGVHVNLLSRGRFDLGAEVGVWVALLRLQYTDGLLQSFDRWDFGPRLALTAAARIAGPLAVALSVEEDLSLAPTPLGTLHPQTIVGSTPRNWLAVDVGVRLSFW